MPHAVPQLQRVDRSEPENIIQAIIDDGCCIIKNFTDKETVDAVNADARPYLDADKPWKVHLYSACHVLYISVISLHVS